MKRVFIISALAVCSFGLFFAYTMYNKQHFDVAAAATHLRTSIEAITEDFQSDELLAQEKYSERVVAISGRLQELSGSKGHRVLVLKCRGITANCGLNSLHNTHLSKLSTGASLTIKGLIEGYDDLLGELQIDRCVQIKPNI